MSIFVIKINKKGDYNMKKKSTVIAAVVLVVLIAVAGLLYVKFKPATTQGEKEITVVVVHADKTEKTFTYQTDAEYLREVLEDNGLIAGDESEYGLFVKTVDGETADDSKQQWWCITKGGESLNTSVDQTPINDKDQFEFTLTEGY